LSFGFQAFSFRPCSLFTCGTGNLQYNANASLNIGLYTYSGLWKYTFTKSTHCIPRGYTPSPQTWLVLEVEF